MQKRTLQALVLVGVLLLSAGLGVAVFEGNTPTEDVPLGAPNGLYVTVGGTTDTNLQNFTAGSDTVVVETDAGNMTVQAAGEANITVAAAEIEGEWTNASSISAANNEITIRPDDKPAATVGGDIERFRYRQPTSVAADDGTVDFFYGGSSGTSVVEIPGAPADTQLGAIDADSNEVLDVTTSDATGRVRFTSLTNSDHNVQLQTSDGGPSLDDTSMSPTGDDLRYENQTLSIDVSDPDLPSDNITLEWYVDGTKRNTTSVGSAGTATATVGPLADGDHDWYVVATDAYGQSDTSTTKTFNIDHHDPVITDADPTGLQSSEPADVSAQINDTDFAKDGDSLTVEFTIDGSVVDTQTVNSNGTYSATIPQSGQTGGDHSWSVQVDDDYGQTVTESYTYSVPDEIVIRNETDHSEILSNIGTVEIRFFGTNEIYTRSTDDGRLNMTGLPVNQNFIVTVQPPDGTVYGDRTVYIQSIYQQQAVYLLNTTKYENVTSRFQLDDPTGQFGSETVLFIEKPINVSGNTQYQTIVADEFGAEGVTATLEEGERYRLRVRSDSGVTQVVGPYRADVSETVTVRPGTPQIDIGSLEDGWAANAELNNRTLTYRYSDPDDETSKLKVVIYRRGHPDRLLVPNETYYDLGNVSSTVTLNESESKQQWVVRFEAERNGDTNVVERGVGNRPDFVPELSDEWRLISGILLLLLSAGAFSLLNAKVGVTVIALEGGILWWTGWLTGATSGVLVVISLMIAIAVNIFSRG